MAPNWFIAFVVQVNGLDGVLEAPRKVRVFDHDDLHMTVAFLGAVSEVAAREGWSALDGQSPPRAVVGSFERVTALGSPRRPSALSALVGEGRSELATAIGELRGPLLHAAGAPPDTRAPLPHVTLARIQRKASGPERRAAVAWAGGLDLSSVTFRIDALGLYTWAQDRTERLFAITERLKLPCE